MKLYLYIFASLLFGLAYASVPAQVYYLLSSYNVPNSLINSLVAVNITYSNNTYTALYQNDKLLFLINDSKNDFVLNVTQIFTIIRNYTIASSFGSINKNMLLSYMHAFQNSSRDAINYCLFETGLDKYTCNVSNSCYSCQTVPVCNLLMYKTDGVTGTFAQDIMNFEKEYSILNNSFNAFYSSISTMNPKNSAYNLAIANSAFANITNMSRKLYTNGLFPITPNITNSMMSQCIFYPDPNTAPWYCYAFGYCEALTYNFSILNKTAQLMASINSKPFSDSQIYTIAYNASLTEGKYIAPILYAKKLAELNRIMNVTLANYPSLLNSSFYLLSHISNASLYNNLNKLAMLRNYTLNNFMSINLTQYNKTLASYMANVTALYSSLNSTYASMLALARNNTMLLLKAELNSMEPSASLLRLSLEELELNKLVSGKINNLSYVSSRLTAINSEAKSIYSKPFGLVELARAIDGPFARSLSMAIPMPYQSNLSLAPLYGAVLSLMLGIILFGVVFLVYMNLKIKGRIIINKRTMRNWRILFIALFALIIIYASITYMYDLKASSFAPISAFDNSVAHSHYVVVVLNGTPTINQYRCGSLVSKNLISMGKEPVLISINNNTCTVGDKTMGLSMCMNFYAQSNIPMVILTNSNTNMLKVYSFYGSYLELRGNESMMDACYPAWLLK
ncbi:MAG: hypothetical protein ACP5JN_03300 [Candidatus Micrarchaeia archaeon]